MSAKANWIAQNLRSGEVYSVTQPAVVWDVKAIRDIADELEFEASNYEGDFADTVNGCADALHALVAAHPTAAPTSAQQGEAEPPHHRQQQQMGVRDE